ncbi:MAG: hypothetical protein KC502_20200 [Myxococcales bacterium]|nr:hypothetical protein [Myxococcales bacterium]
MAISGLVLTLSNDDTDRAAALAVLSNMTCLELGERAGNRLPVVADTPDRRADRDLFERLGRITGVTFAEVAYVWFDTDAGAAAA